MENSEEGFYMKLLVPCLVLVSGCATIIVAALAFSLLFRTAVAFDPGKTVETDALCLCPER